MDRIQELMFQNWVPDHLQKGPFRPKRLCPQVGSCRFLRRDCRPSAGRTLCRCYSRSSQSVVAVLGAQMRSQDARRDGAWRVATYGALGNRNRVSQKKKTTDFARSYFGRLTSRTYASIAKSFAQLRLEFERFLVCGGASAAPPLLGRRGKYAPKRRPPARYGNRKLNDCCLSLTPHCLTEPLCLMQLLKLLNPSSLCQSPSNKCDSQVVVSEPFRPQFQNISRVQFGPSWCSLQPSAKEWDWISRQTCFHSSRQPKPKEFARPLQQTREVP